MREILFRGKTYNGAWVCGQYYKRTHYYGTPSIKHYILISTEALDYDQALTYCEVIPETVGQFTGLFDITGKRIFEGDIMRNAGNVVEFCSDGFCINGDSPLAFWTKTKIIGNIHDKEDES